MTLRRGPFFDFARAKFRVTIKFARQEMSGGKAERRIALVVGKPRIRRQRCLPTR